jgi:hypothetical protein|tara:strand:+ start:890 stop:1090 length:201 start_codon:yes stop_codon:yes gene_type:complete
MDKAQLKYTMMKELKEQLQTNLLQVFEDVNITNEEHILMDVYETNDVRDKVLDHMCDVIIKTINEA